MQCPLCESSGASKFHSKPGPKGATLTYFKCNQCYLIFLTEPGHISPEDEKHRYDQHQNNPDNAGYVQSLLKLVTPLAARLKPGSHGLDFGCGPQSVLKLLFEQRGFSMDIYDPFFFADKTRLQQQYDFVACTEVVEHFRNPKAEFNLLEKLVARGGRLGIMTQFVESERDFADWWYHRDPTHICFYRKETFEWIAEHKRMSLDFPDKNIAIYVK